MTPQGLADDGLLGLITMAGPSHAWGIELRSLLRVEPLAAWKGAPPLDLGAVFGEPRESADTPDRVLVIDTGTDELPLRASGKVAVRAVAWEAIHPLPPWVIGSPRARFLTGIVFGDDGQSPLLIVDVLGLGASLASSSPSSPSPSPSNPREDIHP